MITPFAMGYLMPMIITILIIIIAYYVYHQGYLNKMLPAKWKKEEKSTFVGGCACAAMPTTI